MDKKKQQLSLEDNNLQIIEPENILPNSKKQKLEDKVLNSENLETSDKNIPGTNNIINYHAILENQDNANNKDETPLPVSKTIKTSNHKKINSIMVYYNEYNKRKEWPKKSSINCFWCCHTFTCPPCVLPTKLKYLLSFGLTAIAVSPIIVSGLVVAMVIFSDEFSIG